MQYSAMIALLVSFIPVGVHAQSDLRCPEGAAPRGDIGIRAVACHGNNCALMIDDARGRYAEFSSVPTIRALDERLLSSATLQVGDTVLAIDGFPLTTSRGAQLLAFPPIDGSVRLLVRRNGESLSVVLAASPQCTIRQTSVFVFGSRGSEQAWQLPLDGGAVPQPQPMARPSPRPNAAPTVTLGMELACEGCGWVQEGTEVKPRWTWRAATLPSIVQITPGGPAELAGLRLGDLLVSADGASFTTAAAGEVLRNLRVGVPVRLMLEREGARREVLVLPARRR